MTITSLEPVTISIPLAAGGEKQYVVYKFPAIAGREIMTQYPLSAMPKIGDYQTNEGLMKKIMTYVGVQIEGREPLRLVTDLLIDQHIPEFETLMRLEWAVIDHNCSFFGQGRNSNFLSIIIPKAKALITEILMDLQAQSSAKNSQPSKN